MCVCAGIAGTFFGHPIDTVKVRQQTHPHGQLSTRHCVQLALKNEGVSLNKKPFSLIERKKNPWFESLMSNCSECADAECFFRT